MKTTVGLQDLVCVDKQTRALLRGPIGPGCQQGHCSTSQAQDTALKRNTRAFMAASHTTAQAIHSHTFSAADNKGCCMQSAGFQGSRAAL